MSEIPDERCNLIREAERLSNDEEAFARKLRQAMAIDTLRAERLLLASLQDDSDARQTLFDQIPVCANCYRSLIVHLGGRLAARETEAHDENVDEAISAIEAMIIADIEKFD